MTQMIQERPIIDALNRGERVKIEDIFLKKIEGEIRPGDFYVAERNQGPKLLICKQVIENFVIPTFPAYCYDLWECVRVEEV